MRKGLFSFLILMLSWSAPAAEIVESYLSVRALGMGNAYTTVVDDSDALFYNPAGLSKISGVSWLIADPSVGVNSLDAQSKFNGFSGDDYVANLREFYGERLWLNLAGKSAISFSGFAFAVFGGVNVNFYLTNPAYPNLFINFTNDVGVAMGFAFDLAPEVFSFGLTAKRVTRTGSNVPIGPSLIATLSDEDIRNEVAKQGSGYALDAGMLITFPTPVKPSIALVWKNMGFTKFTPDVGESAPPRIDQEIVAGFGVTFDLPLLVISTSLDAKHLTNTDEQLGKKLHLGTEFSFPLFDLRAGLHQGWYTLGAGVDLGVVRVDAATWGVEVGEYPGQDEDRRYAIQASIELSLDADFGFGGGDGKGGGSRKRLKRRR